MRKFVNRLAIASLVALPVGGALAAMPAGASTGHANFRVVSVHALVRPDVPNSNIVGNGKKAVYNPNHLKFKDVASCGDPSVSFDITNTGTKTAYVTVDGSPFAAVPAGTEEGVCGATSIPKGETDTFGLSNAANTKTFPGTLTVTSKG